MKEIQAPNLIPYTESLRVFLGGSIEMGKAEKWQEKIVQHFKDADVTFLNPRRDDWDSSWVQSIHNPQFNEQVNWELTALELSDVVIINFDPATMSPISLLELGLHARTGKLIVCCPEGFWRKGNVDIVCQKYHITLVEDYEDLIRVIGEKIWLP
jgi:hypothetical protein